MMTFSFAEILRSVFYAIIYGCIFEFCVLVIKLIKGVIEVAGESFQSIIHFKKLMPLPSFSEIKTTDNLGPFLSAALILSFSLGFSLLSYIALDGEIRIYLLLISFASFYLSKFVFFVFLNKLLIRIFRFIFIIFSLAIRLIILPFKTMFSSCKGK